VVAARLVVLASGTGSNVQALLDACTDPRYGATVSAVGSDRSGTTALARSRSAGVPTFELPLAPGEDRADWDQRLTDQVAAYTPDLVVSAGFLKLLGERFLSRFEGRVVNTHPSLLPAFPGMHAPRDALAYGVKVTGATLFAVDAGVDTGPVIAQTAVPIADDDTEQTLHERIKEAERRMLVHYVGRIARNGLVLSGRKATVL
jgi:formyltetrahydrofolate-dependent phosphoribosylglycinamide formyltransferase